MADNNSNKQQTKPSLVASLLGFLVVCSFIASSVGQTAQWQQLTFGMAGPSPRALVASSGGAPVPPPYAPYDFTGIVFYGGTSDPALFEPVFGDLWILNPQDDHNDGRAWTNVPILVGGENIEPPARCLAAIAVNAQGVMFMYGGYNGVEWFDDFWSIDLTGVHFLGQKLKWNFIAAQQYGPNPPLMCGMSMLWIGDIMVLFGGGEDKRLLYSAAWEYLEEVESSDKGWKEENFPGAGWPTPREFHSAVLHPAEGKMYIFGGYHYGYNYYNDTWRYTINNGYYGGFERVELTTRAPPERALCGSTFSPTFNQTMIYGGKGSNGILSDTWIFDTPSSGWIPVPTTGNSPGDLFGMGSAYFVQKDGLLLFGGADSAGNVYNNTWFLKF